jgi:hypothetical protein
MNPIRLPAPSIRSVMISAGAVATVLALGGCAHGTASRTQRETNSTVSQREMRSAAEELATQIQSSPRWQRFVKENQAVGNKEVVILLNEFKNRTTDPKWDTQGFEDLFVKLETVFLNKDIGTVAQAIDRDAPNYWEGQRRAVKQDSDDRYNQQTGKTLTGGLHKTTAVMQIDVCRSELSDKNKGQITEFELRVRLLDAEAGTMILSPVVPIEKTW